MAQGHGAALIPPPLRSNATTLGIATAIAGGNKRYQALNPGDLIAAISVQNHSTAGLAVGGDHVSNRHG